MIKRVWVQRYHLVLGAVLVIVWAATNDFNIAVRWATGFSIPVLVVVAYAWMTDSEVLEQ